MIAVVVGLCSQSQSWNVESQTDDTRSADPDIFGMFASNTINIL